MSLNDESETLSGQTYGSRMLILPQPQNAQRAFSTLIMQNNYETIPFLDACEDRLNKEVSNDSNDFLLVLSLISDLRSWGAVFEIFESKLYVVLPEITKYDTDPQTKDRIRNSLLRLRGVQEKFVETVTMEEAIELLKIGKISLEQVDGDDDRLVDTFRSGVATWSMPYRTREGRSMRFVMFAEKMSVKTPIAILEIGDDAPHNPPRDKYMGFDTSYTDCSKADLDSLANRFMNIRSSLLSDGLPDNYKSDINELIGQVDNFKIEGRGREGNHDEISRRKRFTYLHRLLRAEGACRGLISDPPSGFADGLRVLRDLSIPRTNVELTICGALPPFGSLLVGKLIAGMATHPLVRSFVDRDFGIITKSIFDTEKLQKLISNNGVLIVTTKGLYPGHSSQYNGVQFKTVSGKNAKLMKLGDTIGQTASHISDRTMKLSVSVLQEYGRQSVSKVYGAGGAKRQRTIEAGIKSLGLPPELCHARVSRPVYGLSMVSNLEEIILFNERPEWLISPYLRGENQELFMKNSYLVWANRWLDKAVKRAG